MESSRASVARSLERPRFVASCSTRQTTHTHCTRPVQNCSKMSYRSRTNSVRRSNGFYWIQTHSQSRPRRCRWKSSLRAFRLVRRSRQLMAPMASKSPPRNPRITETFPFGQVSLHFWTVSICRGIEVGSTQTLDLPAFGEI